MRRTGLACLLAGFLGAGAPERTFATPSPSDPLRVPRVESPVKVDGVLDEAAWREALAIPVNTEVRPGENIAAPVDTTVFLAFDSRHLYAAFLAKDPDPSKILARFSDRDDIYDDDWVALVLDTFNDARRAYDFVCNPLGIQGDSIEVTGGGESGAWDAIWDSAGRITPEGYVVEMSIPFSSLRFPPSGTDQIWRFDAVRSYPRGVRHHIGAFPRDRGNNCYLCQALLIQGFAGADPGRNIELDPTLTGTLSERRRAFPDGPFERTESKVDPGITARWSVTPNLTLNGTVNPDFSQVEADAAQLDVNTRFALYYPEKRPFFLEGMDYFQLPLDVVYTRTLADPAWGAKVSGKVGRGVLGAFVVQDEETNLLLPSSQFSRETALDGGSRAGALRYRYDLGRSSTLGVVATDRSGDGGYSNRLLGADAALRFTPEHTLRITAVDSRTRYPDRTARSLGQPSGAFGGSAFDVMYMHETRDWEQYVHVQRFSNGFRSDVGFIPQVGFSFLDTGVLRNWYSDDPRHWFNEAKMWVGYELTRDSAGRRLREVYGSFIEYQGPRQSWLYGLLYTGRQAYRGREFDHDNLRVNGGFRPTGNLILEWNTFYGDDVDYSNVRQAKRLRLNPEVRVTAGKRFRMALGHVYERLWVREGLLYRAHLTELRAVYQFDARAFLRIILQRADYAFSESLYASPPPPRQRSLLSQVLFSYRVNAQTGLYMGYSDRYLGTARVGLTQTDRTVFFKVGYAWVM